MFPFLKPAEFFSTGEYLACCFCLKCERVLVLKGHTGLEHMFSKSQNCGILLPFYTTSGVASTKDFPRNPLQLKVNQAFYIKLQPHSVYLIFIPNL